MQQRIALNGSSFVDTEDLSHHQQVAFIVYGEVARVGQANNRNVSIQGMVILEGAEGAEAVQRVQHELDLADQAKVNGALADAYDEEYE